MFYYTAGRLILPLLIQCILNSLVQNGLHHCDICMRNCFRAQCAAVSICFEHFLDYCQDYSPSAGHLFSTFFHTTVRTAAHATNKLLQGQRLNRGTELPARGPLMFIWTCKSLLIDADSMLRCHACFTFSCVFVCVCVCAQGLPYMPSCRVMV